MQKKIDLKYPKVLVPIKKSKICYEQIKQMIMDDDYMIGDRLPSEK